MEELSLMSAKRALLFTTIQGHASIADSISKQLTARGWSTLTAAFADPALDVYRWVYRYAPWMCGLYYKALYWKFVRKQIAEYTKRSHRPTFEKAIHDFPTDVIIGTSYGFDSLTLELQKTVQSSGQKKPLFINIVVDPRTFFATNIVEDADLNCVFDEEIAQRCRTRFPGIHVVPTGWFVRPEFHDHHPKKELRRELGLDEDVLTFLFVAGSEGEVKSAQLIPELLKSAQPLQIILACGSNEKLRQKFQALVDEYKDVPNKRFITLPFTKELHKYVRSADLLIGKAGPNSIFEAAACGTPFFATTHITGQEDGNLEIIKEYKMGYVEENLDVAVNMLRNIIDYPEELKQFEEPLKKLATYNSQAIDKLTNEIEKLTSQSQLS